MISADTERAWAAGFFDGEGSVPRGLGRSGRPRSPGIAITQASDTDQAPDTLVRFAAAVGVTCHIYGPTLQEGRKPKYSLAITRYADVVAARDALWPYLSEAKRRAFDEAFEAHREVREHRIPRSKPRTHCKYNHAFTPENEYWSQGRRACRTCALERAARQRASRRGATGANS